MEESRRKRFKCTGSLGVVVCWLLFFSPSSSGIAQHTQRLLIHLQSPGDSFFLLRRRPFRIRAEIAGGLDLRKTIEDDDEEEEA